MRKLTITIALMLVVALAVPALGAGHGSFSDVPSDHWAYDAINSLVAAGVVEGYPDGEYKGQESMTRYEMAVMVSRALDNIIAEQEAMAEGLTEGQAADVTAIVESLMERNMPESLTDQQAEEVADIVEALTFELRAELQVLGADLDALYDDVEALEAKVDAMDVPEDNIEFGVTVETIFEVADYGDDVGAAMRLWADGDALDLDLPTWDTDVAPYNTLEEALAGEDNDLSDLVDAGVDWDWEDADDLPSEKRFWQEIGFDVYGNVGDANFNLEVDTLVNVFTNEKSAFGYAEGDESDFVMDNALLTVDYADTTFIVGDHLDANIARYFVDEEDLQGLAVVKNYLDIDWTFLVAGYGEGDDLENDIDLYGVTASTDMDFGTVTARAYQARLPEDQLNVLGLAVSDVALTDVVTVGGEVAFTDSTDAPFNNDSDFLFAVDGSFAVSEELTVTAMFETVGEDFTSWQGDLEEENDYDLASVGATFVLDENNTVSGSYTWVDYAPGAEDKHTVEVMLENVYGDFTNHASVEYIMNDTYTDDYDTRVIELGTEYVWDEVTTLGAALVNKSEEDGDDNVISYNYLKGHMNRELSENTVWNVEANWIKGDVGAAEVEGEASSLTTSLTVSF
ncbi:S-layer homology domain-containing protein [Halanaerobium sp. Z-7514]|uniref:S-layer homology domain-containing protein n=1 Tax=Halanaerobium polyolivorans TaxID=2886943 RepID=A0AAW4X047_9FIRM|nr:S-layer homology domain-containing protein [Halanaerobium polyolivorans]MCC3144916.1 S-layer homology domain-containing protein [Halanaerobium polyolivorans]